MPKSWVSFVIIVIPLFFTIYLSTVENITREIKILCWIIFFVICLYVYVNEKNQRREEDKQKREAQYYHHLAERQELFNRGMPMTYIDGLGENPLFEHFFKEAQKFEKQLKFDKAILEYQKCLSHPKVTAANRVASNILIGNCYYSLSKLKKAEEHYREALNISKIVKDKYERLRGKSAALSNIGMIYPDLDKTDEALQYLKKALEINQKIGYEQEGMASDLNNIGLLYQYLGKPDQALQYHQQALEIHQKIGYEQGMAGALNNIGVIYKNLGKPDEALQYHQQALEIFKRIKAQQQIEIVSNNIKEIKEQYQK